DLETDHKPEHYGLAEWYVGTRGGAGDHAAMVLGKRRHILHLQFFPIRYQHVPLPPGYAVVAINSLHSAAKSDGVRHVFNEKIVAYEIGFRLIRKNHPEFADRLHHLRDVNAANLGISQADIYRLLRELPMTISRAEAVARLGDEAKPLERLLRMHPEPMTGYEVRGVCFFGLAECDRGELAAELLASGRMHEFGRLMYISHDGDRIARRNAEGYRPWNAPVDDAALDALIELSESANPLDREQARLAYQPGGYRCSVLELDEIVDIARRVEGVVGAGLTGAGLGGMVLALTEAEAAPRLLEVLKERYYAPRGLEPAAEVCLPSAGAGFLAAP
ncbi:MAG: galactokinase, partial [Calditrichaeota bacterium]|nr:galactokinase [Calditrichota bacterium]